MNPDFLQPDADDQTLLAEVVNYYQRTLKTNDQALAYLRGNRIVDEAIDCFRIGYCNRTLGQHMPDKKDPAGKIIRERLERLGLLHGRGHEFFINFLVFPVTAADGSGRIVDLYGRRIFDNSHKHIPNHKHLAEGKPGVWNPEALAAGADLIVCAWLVDALVFWSNGYRNVTCSFGEHAPADLLQALKQAPVRRVLTPSRSVGQTLLEAGIECWLIHFPDAFNADGYALVNDPAQELGHIIDKAEKMDKSMGPALEPVPPRSSNTDGGEPEGTGDEEIASPAEESGFFSAEADDQKLLAQIVDFYHGALKGSQEAMDYLRKRGITNGQAVDHFRIGYADRTLGPTLPKRGQAGRKIRERLTQLGIFRTASGQEHFNGCIVFPITAADGTQRIVDLYGRKTRSDLRKGTPLHMHLSDVRHGVWNVEAFGATEEIILCPSLFDALTFWSHGYRNVTCMFGPDALTEDHWTAFKEFNIRRVLTPCEGVCGRLMDAGMDCFLLKLPSGVDANAYALQAADPAHTLGSLLRKAEWVGKGKPASAPVVPLAVEPQHLPDADAPTRVDLDDDDEAFDELADAILAEDDADEPGSPLPLDNTSAPIGGASPVPPPAQEVPAEVKADEVVMTLGNRRYRVRGWSKNLAFDQMRINLMASNERGMFVDTFDLYSAKHRRTYIVQAAIDLAVEENVIKKDLGRVLLQLEQLQDKQIEAALVPKDLEPVMTPGEKEEAIRLLKDPNLLQRLVEDFDVVGEQTNKLVGYLAAVSRKLDQPLAIIIQSSSAAGKTALMEAVLAFMPPEDQVKFSAMTGQSLFYMGESNLKHKILAIVEEEGAERASYALKLLQSEGELRIASTGKDAASGRLVTQEYRVEGPMMLFLTTTAIKVDEELLNRCLVLTVDEDREQTKAIHHLQRRRQTLQGLLSAQGRQRTLNLHHNAQRLLRPLLVANPFAESLTFLDDKTRTRRDHMKYLTLIRAITLLHQHQRPVKTIDHQGKQVEFIEVTLEDIEMANKLACEVLGRSIDDLPPQTRRLLCLIDGMVTQACRQQRLDRADYRFSRRDIRAETGWGHTQLKVHLKRLEELEYLLVHRGGRGQSIVYELLYDAPAEEGQPFLARLIDVDKLRRQQQQARTTGERSGQN